MKISVLGCGRWGSFLGWYLSTTGSDVALFGRKTSASFSELVATGKNEYLTLPKSIILTDDLGFAVERAEVVVISISSQNLAEFIPEVIAAGLNDKPVVLCMKGIDCKTGRRLSQVATDAGVAPDKVAVWVGPGHIQEFVSGKPNCMVIDSASPSLTRFLADSFKSKLIRFYYGDDLIGNEIGAAAKNVMGIAAGMLDGGGLATLKGPLMARGAREVSRLIKAMGGNELSAYGLCHLGDYETTLFSPYSHNRRYGEALIRGEKFDKLAEGVMTAKAMRALGEKYGEELPITNAVCGILFDGKKWDSAFTPLFERTTRNEFY